MFGTRLSWFAGRGERERFRTLGSEEEGVAGGSPRLGSARQRRRKGSRSRVSRHASCWPSISSRRSPSSWVRGRGLAR